MDYKKLLKKARKELPESVKKTERFEIPKVRGHIEGNKTIISNFQQIADTLGRPVEHLLKYVLRELATPGDMRKDALIIGTKISASRVNEKIQQYAEEFVICSECKRPDTKMTKEDKVTFIKCLACGARHPVK
ncbi:translation initiation factor IF-2 subunit beta [Candidatus Woesearchaeota archaeon]|nr:translation initiation factor IF-2 subunit beta [Candidatus Woesearchaeota archaeon]